MVSGKALVRRDEHNTFKTKFVQFPLQIDNTLAVCSVRYKASNGAVRSSLPERRSQLIYLRNVQVRVSCLIWSTRCEANRIVISLMSTTFSLEAVKNIFICAVKICAFIKENDDSIKGTTTLYERYLHQQLFLLPIRSQQHTTSCFKPATSYHSTQQENINFFPDIPNSILSICCFPSTTFIIGLQQNWRR